MKLLGVGNEQWGPQYVERYQAFARVLKARHPEITLITGVGPSPDGERFDFLWRRMRELKADVVDEHYYMPPKWFRENAGRYDSYPRTGPKVFAGEYAAQSVGVARPENRNNWECALSEAAFVTGLERNADVVRMSSYAPLLGHVDAWQWTPNLIWFDNLRSYGTPSYYVQQLFSTNRGTDVLPVTLDGSPRGGQGDLYCSASRHGRTRAVILKLVNTAPARREVRIRLAGAGRLARSGTAQVLSHADLKAENSLDQPKKVAPVVRTLSVPASEFTYPVEGNSVTVLRLESERG
jgi:alpha-L-arabinofuranosidase